MARTRLIWVGKCLLFCLLGVFIAGRLSDLLNPLIWWALRQNGTTVLSRNLFIAMYYLQLMGVYGLLLGLIPYHRLQEALASVFGRVHFKAEPQAELASSRPILWAWVPVGFAFVLRFLTFSVHADHSVLGSTSYRETRFEHFFGPLDLNSTRDPVAWMIDRFALAGPTLFLLSFTFGIWLRHQFPERPTVDPEAVEPS